MFRQNEYVAVCCSALQCIAVCCSWLQIILEPSAVATCFYGKIPSNDEETECVAVCCSVLTCAAVCCSVP